MPSIGQDKYTGGVYIESETTTINTIYRESLQEIYQEQATTEITLQQLASGGATTMTRRYRLKERRIVRLLRPHPK